MKAQDTSVLGYALLGLIYHKPSSGYDLRKTFAETAMGNYSSSPGAIYPALARLESQGLIRGVVENAAGLRRRRLYKLTPKGDSELKKWLTRPIGQADVMRGASELMLRFASWIERWVAEADDRISHAVFAPSLSLILPDSSPIWTRTLQHMPLSGRLALESGIRGYRSLYDWTSYAIRTYRQAPTSSPSRHARTKQGGPR